MKSRSVVLMALLVCTALTASVQAQVDISIDPAVVVAKPDSHFVVCLDLAGVTPEMFIGSVQFTLTFDTCVVFWDSLLTFDGTCMDSTGWDIKVHNESYTNLEVWLIGGQPLDCNGCALRIGFRVNGDCVQACGGDSTLLHFSNVVINEGDPQAVAHDGMVYVNRGPHFTSPDDGSVYHVKEGPDEGCDTLCYTISATDPDGDKLTILWLPDDSTMANGATLDTLGPGQWEYCWAPPKRPGNSLAGACYADTFVVFSSCGAGGFGSPSCCYDTIMVSTCADSLFLHAFWPDTAYHACGRIEVPLYLETNYGFCFEDLSIYSFDLTLSYDTEHLDVFEVGNEGLITEDLGALVYCVKEDLGHISVSTSLNTELSGCVMPQPIIYVGFEVAGGTQVNADLGLFINHVKINEAYPTVCWENGSIEVTSFSLAGDVFYSDNFRPIADAEVKIWVDDPTMTPPADDTVYTDVTGHYGISSLLGCSDYCVKVQMEPFAMPDPIQVITSLDAAYILMFLCHSRIFSHNDSLAADVTRNGEITGYDASQLLREIVGISTPSPIGEWIFEPDYRCYADLSTSRMDEDYEGVVIGDVTQNWPGDTAPKNGLVIGPDVIIPGPAPRHGDVEEKSLFTFPITFSKASGIIAAEFRLTYDPAVLAAVKACTTALSSGFYLEYRIDPGQIRFAMAGEAPLSGSGTIAEVVFETAAGETDLDIYVRINEQMIINLPYPTKIVVGAPSGYALHPNYPNPFNPTTTLTYTLPVQRTESKVEERGTLDFGLSTFYVTLRIFNVLGQEVRTLVDEPQAAGMYSITWDGKDNAGREVGSGVYFYRLASGDYQTTERMLLVK